MSLPIDALTHIDCNICGCYLSYFPIYLNLNSLQPICGRCSRNIENGIRNTTYETLVQFMRFPCSYDFRGCTELLSPKDVPEHEATCLYRTFCCDLLSCVWEKSAAELINHVQNVHPTALLSNGKFEISTADSYKSRKFLLHDDELFTLQSRFNKTLDILWCSLFRTTQTTGKYFYEMSVFNDSQNHCVIFPVKQADSYSEENITKVDVKSFKKKLNDPSVLMGYIKVVTLEQKQEVFIGPNKLNLQVNQDLLHELKCPVCLEYIIPPIYQCIVGHCVCGDCKSGVTTCPICKGSIKFTRNITLENMASCLMYPCRNLDYGCQFSGKPDQVRQHLPQCSMKPLECLLSDHEACSWTGLYKDFLSHVADRHRSFLLETDDVCVMVEDGPDSQCYIKKFGSQAFKIDYYNEHDHFCWTAQFVGQQEEARNYKFEIDINNNCKKGICLWSLCSHLENTTDLLYQTSDQHVHVYRSQIDLSTTDPLRYVLRISNASVA